MLLTVLTVGIMLAVTYAYLREGLLTCLTGCVNVFLSGLLAFNFFEPVADQLEATFRGSFLMGYEDCLSLAGIFAIVLGILRLVTANLSPHDLEYDGILLQAGRVVLGLLTGYLVAGFLAVACLTLPLPEGATFAGHHTISPDGEPRSGLQAVLPPDMVWLSLMHRAGAGPFRWGENDTFDERGNFLLRYERYHRFDGEGKLKKKDGVLLAK